MALAGVLVMAFTAHAAHAMKLETIKRQIAKPHVAAGSEPGRPDKNITDRKRPPPPDTTIYRDPSDGGPRRGTPIDHPEEGLQGN